MELLYCYKWINEYEPHGNYFTDTYNMSIPYWDRINITNCNLIEFVSGNVEIAIHIYLDKISTNSFLDKFSTNTFIDRVRFITYSIDNKDSPIMVYYNGKTHIIASTDDVYRLYDYITVQLYNEQIENMLGSV